MSLRSTTKPHVSNAGVDRTKHMMLHFFMRGVIVPPSKLLVYTLFTPRGIILLWVFSYEGGRLYQKSLFVCYEGGNRASV